MPDSHSDVSGDGDGDVAEQEQASTGTQHHTLGVYGKMNGNGACFSDGGFKLRVSAFPI